MAKINFKADKESESMGGGGNFSAAPRGIYWLQITEITDGLKTGPEAKNPGIPKTRFTLEIADDDDRGALGKKVWHTVPWIPRGSGDKAAGGHGMAVHWLHACKMPFDGSFSFDEQDFLEEGHCMIRALLEIEPYTSKAGYQNESNVIREIYTDTNPEPKELPPPPKAKAKAPARQLAGAAAGNAAKTGKDPIDPDLGW